MGKNSGFFVSSKQIPSPFSALILHPLSDEMSILQVQADSGRLREMFLLGFCIQGMHKNEGDLQ